MVLGNDANCDYRITSVQKMEG